MPKCASIFAIACLANVAVSGQSPATLQSLQPADLDAFISRVVADQKAIGGEVSTLRMLAGKTPISTLMYRAPDGTIAEFLFSRR